MYMNQGIVCDLSTDLIMSLFTLKLTNDVLERNSGSM